MLNGRYTKRSFHIIEKLTLPESLLLLSPLALSLVHWSTHNLIPIRLFLIYTGSSVVAFCGFFRPFTEQDL